jgi:hypothetical protein
MSRGQREMVCFREAERWCVREKKMSEKQMEQGNRELMRE